MGERGPLDVLGDLPEVTAVVPELAGLAVPDETRATCARCAMAPDERTAAHAHRAAFTAAARCCTYHPGLPNYRAGRALRRGGIGAAKVRERLANPEGLTATRLGPPPWWMERYAAARRTGSGFGTDEGLTCPFWVAGPLGCSIHADREAVCRTWHCRHVDGAAGRALWVRLQSTMEGVEDLLSRHLAELGGAPAEGASAGEWEAWYLLCAARADQLTEAEIAALRRPGIVERAEKVVEARAELDREMPDVLAPSIRFWHREPGDPPTWAMSSWSGYDYQDLPAWIFGLLARLDGRTPWQDARDAAEVDLGVDIPDSLVVEMWRTRLLTDPQELDAPPGVSVRVNGPVDLVMGAEQEG